MNGDYDNSSNTYPALPGFDACLIPAFGGRYVTQEVQLFVRWTNPVLGTITVDFCARMLLDDGRITEFRFSVPLLNNATPTTKTFPLTKGYVLAAALNVTAGSAMHGAVFAQIGLQYSQGADASVAEVLAQGYVTNNGAPSFPYGQDEAPGDGSPAVRAQAAVNPGLGLNPTILFPQQCLIRLCALTVSLSTSAVVANRIVNLDYPADGTAAEVRIFCPNAQAASFGNTYYFAIGAALTNNANQPAQQIPLPDVRFTSGGANFGVNIINLDAGDRAQVIGGWFEYWAEL